MSAPEYQRAQREWERESSSAAHREAQEAAPEARNQHLAKQWWPRRSGGGPASPAGPADPVRPPVAAAPTPPAGHGHWFEMALARLRCIAPSA